MTGGDLTAATDLPQDLLGEVSEQHRPATLARVAVLSTAATASAAGNLADELRADAKAAARTLAGSGGTFGFHLVSELAREAEALLRDTAAATPESSARLVTLVACIEDELNPGASASVSVMQAALPMVLLVVSDALLRQRLAVEAGRRGMRVAFAGTADDVAVQVGRERPAVALVDLLGERRDSAPEEILSRLSSGARAIPTLVLATSDDFGARFEAARRGAEGFVDRAAPAADVMDRVSLLVERKAITGARVIVVDEDPIALLATRGMLERGGFEVHGLQSPLELWEMLTRVNPSLLVIDIRMSGLDGVDLCRVLRNDARWALVPIMVVTSSHDAATLSQAFAAGADDYLVKPVVEAELIPRAKSQLERYRLHQALAETDALTGLANRRTSTASLGQMIRLADRMEKPMCVVEIDLDHFKQVNDRYGHVAGDIALRGLSDLLRRTVRAEDLTARWGGEEFIVGMFGVDRNAGVDRIADLLSTFRAIEFTAGDDTFQLTFSAGVAQYPVDGRSLDALYQSADAALYAAKDAGRNQVAGASAADGTSQQVTDVAIIEDDDATAALIAHGLDEVGLRWWRFSNGASAAATLCGRTPRVRARVVLLDIGIPAFDGFEILRLMGSDNVLSSTRVLMLTGSADEDDRRLSQELGASGYLSKPFSLPSLMQTVTEALGR